MVKIVKMPSIPKELSAQNTDTCTMYLVRDKDGGDVETAIRVNNEVLYISAEGFLSFSSVNFLHEAYTIIREYTYGDTLSITFE